MEAKASWIVPLRKRKIPNAESCKRWRDRNPEQLAAYRRRKRGNDRAYRLRVKAAKQRAKMEMGMG